MSNDLMRAVYDALLPPGSLWFPEESKEFDQFLDGMADNAELIRLFMEQLATLRNPNFTTILSDLEREYGIQTDTRLTEDVRRQRLSASAYAVNGGGAEDFLENTLIAAGFDVLVHQNDPAVDPATFLDQSFQMVAGGLTAVAGHEDAFAARIGGELLVNGDIFQTNPLWLAVAGGGTAFAGHEDMFAGSFDELEIIKIEYPIPTDPAAWPMVFFVGGPATRDPGTGALTAISSAEVPIEREQELKRTILKLKPMHTWAGLIITYV